MTETLEAVELHPVEIDLLCEFAEVRPPFPLTIPSTGKTETERRLTFRAAREQLARRGLAGRRGPLGPAGTFVDLLHYGSGVVDLILDSEGHRLNAVGLLDDSRALLATQSPDSPGALVRLTELPVDDVVFELQALIPSLTAGIVPAFTVPLMPLRRAFDRMSAHRHVRLSDGEVDELLRESGVDELVAARLANNLRQIDGHGQLGAARWAGGGSGRWRRLGDEVHWLDTPRGRFQLHEDADTAWASVNPLSTNEMRAALRELSARVRIWP